MTSSPEDLKAAADYAESIGVRADAYPGYEPPWLDFVSEAYLAGLRAGREKANAEMMDAYQKFMAP